MKTLNINYPYNNRLYNNVFSLYMVDTDLKAGNFVEVACEGILIGRHQVLTISAHLLKDLTNYECLLSFGEYRDFVRDLFRRTYPSIDFNERKILRVVLKKSYYSQLVPDLQYQKKY